jgi:hypothetical protein
MRAAGLFRTVVIGGTISDEALAQHLAKVDFAALGMNGSRGGTFAGTPSAGANDAAGAAFAVTIFLHASEFVTASTGPEPAARRFTGVPNMGGRLLSKVNRRSQCAGRDAYDEGGSKQR